MSDEQELWELEERFWLDGAETYRKRLSDDAVMVFPYPAGILQGKAIVDGVDAAPRWRSVVMADRVFRRRGDVALLAYRASAEREGEPLKEMLCASTYLDEGGDWQLISHQQTPVEGAEEGASSADGS